MSQKTKRKRLRALLSEDNLIPNIDTNDLGIFTYKELTRWVARNLDKVIRVGKRTIRIKGMHTTDILYVYCEPIDSGISLIPVSSDIGRYLKGGYYVKDD